MASENQNSSTCQRERQGRRLGYPGDAVDLRRATQNVDSHIAGTREKNALVVGIQSPAQTECCPSTRSVVERPNSRQIKTGKVRAAQRRVDRALKVADSIGGKQTV